MTSMDAFAEEGSGIVPALTRRKQWFVATRAGIFPMTVDAIQQSFERGLLHTTTKVWTSGMRAWESLGSIAGLIVTGLQAAPSSLQPSGSQPVSQRSYPPALPAPNKHDRRAATVIAPPPVSHLLAPRAEPRVESRAVPRAEPSALRSAEEHWLARGVTWVRRLETWQSVLCSFVAGTLLGLVMYSQLLWGGASPSVAPNSEASHHEQTSEVAASGARAADPSPAVPADTRRSEPTSLAASLVTAPVPTLLPTLVSTAGTPQAKRSAAKRGKPARRAGTNAH